MAWPTAPRPWSHIHIDHFFVEDKICLLVVDSLSKYLEVEIVKSVSTKETVECLSSIFACSSLPDTLVSDNATSFTSFEFKEFLSKNGVKHITPPAYCPSSNGQAERSVRTIIDLLKNNRSTQSLTHRLSQVLLQYRSVPHNTTQVAPAVALNNRMSMCMT